MSTLRRANAWGNLVPLRRKLTSLGVQREADLDAIISQLRIGSRFGRGEIISSEGLLSRYWAVLLDGVACIYNHLEDGRRQIYSFQYSGDFCDPSCVLQASVGSVAVSAVTDCSIGLIERQALEELIVHHPVLALVLWRSAVLETSALRARMLSGRQDALQRVTNFLCEQMCRQSAIGIDSAIIPLKQVDIADALGLSTVHINRTFKDLQAMGVLSKAGRSMKVVDREKLARLGDFDGSYLNLPPSLSRWEVAFGETLPKAARRGDELPVAPAPPAAAG